MNLQLDAAAAVLIQPQEIILLIIIHLAIGTIAVLR
jgi:hypothetical protein